jgi:hypothetical protein
MQTRNKILSAIFKNEELSAYILIILIFAIISFIRFSFPGTVDINETKELVVILASKPEFYKGGEYSDSHFSLYAEGFSSNFKITEYAYYLSENEKFNSLKTGDTLKLLINRDCDDESIDVYGIKNTKNEDFITLNDYNYSKRNEWKDLWFVVLFISLVFWPMIIRRWITKNK